MADRENKKYLFNPLRGETKRDRLFVLVSVLFMALAVVLPTGFEGRDQSVNSSRVRGRIVDVNNEKVKIIGPVKQGEQQLEVQILSGPFRERVFSTGNNMVGKIELDKLFAEGDTVLVVLSLTQGGEVSYAQVIDHYRTGKTLFLCFVFFCFIILFMGWMGVKIAVSFVFTGVMLVRLLFPAILKGWDPILASLIIVSLLTAVIIFLVGGLTRRGFTAFAGSMGGVLSGAALAYVFTRWFKLHGAVRPFAEALLYSGYAHLNLVHLFIAGIFLAGSGAMMDLAMDIAAAMDEIQRLHPAISRAALVKSGLSVARHAAGTMSTTLLLAYSAEYTAMIMTFIAQGVPLENIINMVYVSSEIVHTLVGCFGLVLVAPLTVFAGGVIFPLPSNPSRRRAAGVQFIS